MLVEAGGLGEVRWGSRMQREGWSSRAVGLGSARQGDHPSLKQQACPRAQR